VVSPQNLSLRPEPDDTIHVGREKGTPLNDEWVQKFNEAGDWRIQDLMSALRQYEELFQKGHFLGSVYPLKRVKFGPKLDASHISHAFRGGSFFIVSSIGGSPSSKG